MRVVQTSSGWRVHTDDGSALLRWWRDANGVGTINADGAVAHVAVDQRGAGREVTVHGSRWRVYDGPRPVERAASRGRAGDGQVRSPMPASVVGVHVEAGDRVERGQPLVTLTAMKMEIVCDAPGAAVVERVSCAIGDLVTADEVLVTLGIDSAHDIDASGGAG